MATGLRNFHVPLPQDLYDELREVADRSHQPATTLARQAIADLVRQRRELAVHEAIASYASEVAGSPEDLDPALAAAAHEVFSEEESW